MKAGSKVQFKDLEVGMTVRVLLDAGSLGAKSGVLAVEGVIQRREVKECVAGYDEDLDAVFAEDRFMLGTERDTFTLLEDFNEPKLPEREGLVVASWSRDKNSFSPIAGDKVLGHWKQAADGRWAFKPITRSPFSIGASRITAITEVTPVPDDALQLLADLQHHMASPDEPSRLSEARAVVDAFFRRVNEVQG